MTIKLILLSLCFYWAVSLTSEELKKIKELQYLTENSKDNIIMLDKEQFENYVVSQPRSYIFALLFTAENMECEPCKEFRNELSSVAYSFHEHQRDQPVEKVPIFFGLINYKQETMPLFNQFKFQSVPNFFLTFPNSLKKEKNIYVVPKEDFMDQNNFGEIYAQKILEFINLRTRNQVEMRSSPIAILFYLVILICLLTFLVFFAFKIKVILLNPCMWFAVSAAVYFICMSGTIYNIIHNVPFAYQNPRNPNEVEYIEREQRGQYAGEGYLAGFLNKIENKKQQIIFAVIVVLCFGLSLYWINEIYRIKASWYGPTYFPPDYYIKGSLMRDQGNSF